MRGAPTFGASWRLGAIVAPLFCLFLGALPASAQIQGYGKDATGGAGGSVCTVTTSASSGTGSFSSCLSVGNRTIQFAVASATVGSTQYVKSNTTIDGCANGQNGVTLDQSGGLGRSVIIEGPVSNVIVRCMRFQGPAGTSEGSDLLGLDGTGGQISRVAVDRSTFVGAADGALDITGDVSDLTVQKSLFYGSVLTQLIKYDTRMRISIHHNVYTAGGERNPQIKGDATAFDFVSNVVHANTLTVDSYGTRLWSGNSSSDSPGNVQINMVANAFMGTNGNIIIQTDSGASASGIYIASNNYCSPASNCPSSPASSPFTVPAAYAVTPTLPGCMATAMLPGVGSPNRTATDTQKVNAVAAALPTNCTGGTTPTISIGDASVTEGNSGTTTATFTATLSASASGTVTVGYSTANGTATAGSDYVAQSGTLTFTAGQTTRTIAVVVNGDTAVEPNETFTVNLASPTGATILDGLGVGTIVTDDSLPSLSIGDISVSEGNTGTKVAALTVTLSAASASPVSVTYATANGTATAGTDYAAVGGSVTFPAGTTSQTVNVTVNGDTTVEPNETFVVNLSAPSGATILDAQGVGTITNDDSAALPTLSIGDVSVIEGNSGITTATFTATLSAAASGTVTVGYSTANGTATAGSDYVAQSGTLTFTAGQTTKTVVVVVNGDLTVEPNETFMVNLSSPTGATILDGQGVGTIMNNDGAALPTLSIGDVSVTEGNSGTTTATLTATLSAAASGAVTVNFATANSTATAGSDYVAQSGTLTFTAGQITKTIIVTVNGDIAVEANETFTVNLTTPAGATILDAQGVATITNDDAAAGAQPVVWTSLVGVAVSGNSLTDLVATGTFAGAVSTQQISSGDGYVEFAASETTTNRVAGLSTGNTSASYADVDFGIAVGAAPQAFYVLEKGVNRGSFGTYVTGDLFRVAVVGGVVKYSKNGIVFYTSTQTRTYPLLVDTSLYNQGATLSNVVIGGVN